jgi:arylsulfatase
LICFLFVLVSPSQAQTKRPNILVIMGNDIGWYNTNIYNRGDMCYQTPNIDRIGKEGAMFLAWYGQQSCTAGRAAFVTGQSPIRTGLTKVGLPVADVGLSDKTRPWREFLKHKDKAPDNSAKPPGRPQRVSAVRTWFRCLLREPISPDRWGGAGES